MFKKILLMTLLTLLSCNVTKPVIVTKKRCLQVQKKVATRAAKNKRSQANAEKKQQGQVDEDGEVIESTSVICWY
jgi:hypothetical protein